jgi:hypothetical protein
MMTDIKNGGPAFPLLQPTDPNFRRVETGMSLRDWFAGQAVSALPIRAWPDEDFPTHQDKFNAWAKAAYAVADAMLAARLTGDQR